MRTIYSLLFNIGFLLAAPYYFYRLWRRGNWKEGFAGRLGNYSSKVKQALTNRHVVWVHGVSVGEAGIASTLVKALETRLPQIKFVVSTTTTTGMGELRKRLPVSVEKVYYPIDRRPWVRRAFAILHPQTVVLIEAEMWPNFLWQARRRRVPVVLVNARISERSYRRYRMASFLFRDLFRGLAAVGAQSEADAGRLRRLGSPEDRVHVVGSLKFEPAPASDPRALDVSRLLRHAGMPQDAMVLLAASTHEGEEALLAEIFRRLRREFPRLFLVLVPRHFERCKSVGAQLHRRGVRYVYRSEVNFGSDPEPGSAECLLVNSTGELRWFFPHADVVFVGKSLIGKGGQNPIEPAAAGRAIVFGPHMQNFRDIVPRFLDAGAALQVADKEALGEAIASLLRDPVRRDELGRRARDVVEANRGALDRTIELVVDALAERGVIED